MSTKVLLVGEQLKHRAFNGSNQALPWLASALNNNGFADVTQFDMENSSNTLDELLRQSETADAVMFCGTFSVQLDRIDQHALEVRKRLETIGRRETPIIVGGYGASQVDRYSAHAPFIDAFFYGPGIEQIVTIAQSVKAGTFLEDRNNIAGISYYDETSGKFIRGRPVPLPSEKALGSIDQLFQRDYIPEIHDMEDIFFDEDGNKLSTFQLVTELGCPYVCTFCSESGGEKDQMFVGRGVREVPLEKIEETFANARKQGYKAVYFDVETAFRNWKRMENIMVLMSKYDLIGGLNTRIDTVTESRIQRAAELGAVYTFYGVEHINPQVLFAIDKFAQRDPQRRVQHATEYEKRVEEAFTWINDAGIQSSLFLIMGLPKISNKSWKQLIGGAEDLTQVEYEPTTFEDDKEAIERSFALTRPYHFNANILRLNPDTSMAWQSRYACIRPSGEDSMDAVWFVPRVAQKLGLTLQDFHPVYRFFEGVESNQPYSTAIDPQRAYDTALVILNTASQYGTHVYFDPHLQKAGLIQKDNRTGAYKVAPLKEFENFSSPD